MEREGQNKTYMKREREKLKKRKRERQNETYMRRDRVC
jgi:hypothetical protein